MHAITCLDVGGTFIRYGRAAPDGSVAEAGRVATPARDLYAFTAALSDAARRTGAEILSLSIAGGYDRRSGLGRVANIPCLDGRAVSRELGAALGLPVIVTNDADCFALAEAHRGTGRDAPVVFGIILGSGVGGGVVANGRLLDGFGGISGEWGHGPIVDPTAGGAAPDMPAFPCGCGLTGCIDAVCSARGMEKLHAAMHGETLPSTAITATWHAGEPKATVTVELFVRHLSRSLSVVVNTLGAAVVPVSGGLSNDPELVAAIDRATRALVLADYPEPLVVPGTHAADGGLVGAAIAAQQALADGTLP